MITQFKQFESVRKFELDDIVNIKAGDYILAKSRRAEGLYDILAITIGKILRVRNVYGELDIEFDQPIGRMFGFPIENIKYWSPNREDLEMILVANKYNL